MEQQRADQISDLRGERVRLMRLTTDHLPAVQRWRSDPHVTRYWITRHVPSLDDLTEWLSENDRSGSLTWTILDEQGTAIGYCNAFAISLEHRHCEIALMIGERGRWGQGYAREALRVLLDYLLSPAAQGGFGMHKVSLAVFAENEAARRAYRAIGFREDGALREDMYYDGRWHDQILMSILEDEFQSAAPTR